ncbi:MAG: terpene cyclase/mutase family protein [Planctomycetes bacterium]|nr:terpene cyclase/mutase family protein [Planctomycetota bacterium]
MKKGNALLVIVLILLAGVIISVSVYFTAKQTPHGKKDDTGSTTATGQTSQLKTLTTSELLEQTFEKGLAWLMKRQQDNGAWQNPPLPGGKGSEPDVAFTALAIISVGKAPQKYRETYKSQIEKGIKYLLDHVNENGEVIDSETPPTYATYKTSLAIVALVTIDKEKYKDSINKAMDYLVKNQFGPEDGDAQSGGWGYQEKGPSPKKNANLSTTQFVMMALNEGGLPEDSDTWKRAVEFLNKVQSSSENNKFRVTSNDGGFFYSPIESKAEKKEVLPDGTEVLKSYASMTYSGLLSFIYAYVDKKDPRVQAAYNWIKQKYSLEENVGLRTDEKPNLGKQGLYYYYHSFAKALDAYGEATIITMPDKTKHNWAKDLTEKLALLQKNEGFWVNEFEERWFEGYEGLATSFALISLDICRKWVKPETK